MFSQPKLSFERTNPGHLKTYRKPSSSVKRGDSSQQNRSLEFGFVKPSDIKSFFGRSGSGGGGGSAAHKRDPSFSLYDPDSLLNSYSCICRSDLNIRDYLPSQAFAEELSSGYSFYQGLTIHSCWMEPEDRLKREGSAWSLDLFHPMQRQAMLPERQYVINTDEESRDMMEIQYSQQQLDGAYIDQFGPSSTEIPTDYPDEHIDTLENEYLRPDILFQQQDSHIADAVVASHTQSSLNQVSPMSNRNWLENEDDSPPYDSSEEDGESAKIAQKRSRNVLGGSSKVIVITDDDDLGPTTKKNNTSPSTDRKSIRSISERKRKSSNVFSKRIAAELAASSSSSLDFTAKDVERGSSKRQSLSDYTLLRAPLFDTFVSPVQNLRVVQSSAAVDSELFDKELAVQLGFSSDNDEPIFVGEGWIDSNQQKSSQTPKRSSRSFLPNETIVIDSSDDDQNDEIEDVYQSTRINAGSSSSRSKVSRPGVIDVLSDDEEDKENNGMSTENEMSDELKNFLKNQFEPREKKRKGKSVDEDGLPLPASRNKKKWPGNRGGGRWRGRGRKRNR